MTTCRHALAALAVVLAGVWLDLALPTPALAHDALVSSDPADAGLVDALPSRASLIFSGEVREVHEIEVTGPGGSVVNGAATIAGAEVRQNLWEGPDGAYVMTYDVVSSDGHDVIGEVRFEVGPLPVAASGGIPAAVTPSGAPASDARTRGRRTTLLAASVLLVGVAVQVVVRRRRHRETPTRRAGRDA